MSDSPVRPSFDEPHYTPGQLAKMTHIGETTIRRWFYDEPGVLRIASHGKKPKVHLRIPLHVAERVYNRYVQGGWQGRKSA